MAVCAASQNFSKPTSPHTQQWWVDCWSLLLEACCAAAAIAAQGVKGRKGVVGVMLFCVCGCIRHPSPPYRSFCHCC